MNRENNNFKIYNNFVCFNDIPYMQNRNTFNEGSIYIIKKDSKMLNLNLNKKLFLIQKANYHIYIYQKFLISLIKKILEEQNLNTVMLLNPKNEEAIFII